MKQTQRSYNSTLRTVSKKRQERLAKEGPKPRAEVRKRSAKKGKVDYADAQWAAVIKARSGGVCQRCGRPGQHSHHVLTKKTFPEHRHDTRNGIYLCAEPCHREAHDDMNALIRWWASESPEFAELLATARRIEK